MNKLLVIGSTNTDMVIKTDRFPKPGETIIGGTFLVNPGGKGANQAVAAVRLGGYVTFLTKLGKDAFGNEAINNLKNEGIDTTYLFEDESNSSGVALITINSEGENTIVVAPGANNSLSIADVNKAASLFNADDLLLMQLEIPLETILHASKLATAAGMKIILNPAPAAALPAKLLKNLFLITPNETEAEILTGITVNNLSGAAKAARALKALGVKNVIITMGSQGAFVATDIEEFIVSAPSVKAIDTTAAGDIFNGALAFALSQKKDWKPAVELACKAAAISVTRMGAQASAPTANELNYLNLNQICLS